MNISPLYFSKGLETGDVPVFFLNKAVYRSK